MTTRPTPDIDQITEADLRSDSAMTTLYLEAVRRKFWPNRAETVLDFWSLAEKALNDDKRGTPGKLFYALLKAKSTRLVTDAMERRAMARIGSAERHELVQRADGLNGLPAPVPEEVQSALFGRDIGYHHGVMMQCFLPQKALADDQREWQVSHGRASMLVEAGRVVDPERDNTFRKCAVPSGSKARFIIPYIIGSAVLHNSREIDMGRSLRRFMEKLGFHYNGRNGAILTREVENVAAANFYLGGWDEEGATTQYARVAKELSFWVERNPDQGVLWRPEMVLSADFFEAIKERRVPVDMGHLRKLSKSPRRMDLYCWLSYRLPRIRKGKAIPVPLRYLQPIFAPDIADPHYFKQALRTDLRAIAKIYPDFALELKGDALTLRKSPPPVPPKLVHLL